MTVMTQRGLYSVIVSVTIAFLPVLSSSAIVPYSSLSPNWLDDDCFLSFSLTGDLSQADSFDR